ncbi:MAG: polysulfide reductase NrfD [Coriobacteriales bacterium]|jgi:formate-dependent nitrite reductase membrane component NrfD|nr:polysulfide reductase NrfD [Coriobacteriales bacterium]
MFDTLSVWYLFFGGTSSGVLLLCSFVSLFFIREPFGSMAHYATVYQKQVGQTINAGFIAGEALLLTGIVCLLLDLGRSDRLLNLLISPNFSILSVGAYALVLLAILGFSLVLPRLFYLPCVSTVFVRTAETATLVVAFVSMLYTGLLLFSMKAVHFWDNPLIPILFVFSSLSSAIALLAIISFFSEKNAWYAPMLQKLTLVDLALIILEIISIAVFLLLSRNAESIAAQDSLANLLSGKKALTWWFGFVILGMLAPLTLELLFIKGNKLFAQAGLAIVAVMILVGAFCLRDGLVGVGVHSDAADSFASSELQNTSPQRASMMLYE